MKVLFSNPPWWEGKEGYLPRRWRSGVRAGSRWPFTYLTRHGPDKFKFGIYLPYPFFMGYAATYARKATGADVRMRDSIALRESYEGYYRHLKEERYDYIFIESATPSWENDSRIVTEIRRVLPDCRIVLTGPITVAKGEEILSMLPVHACIRGEYEKGAVRVLEKGESGIIDFDLLTRDEMNNAPYPWYDDATALRYYDCNPRGQIAPQAQIWTSRGCPYKCIFCVWPATMTGNDPDGTQRRTVRHYTPQYIEGLVTELVDRYKFKSIYFDDDTFNLGDKHVLGICEVMARLKLPWSAMCRADTIKLDTWRAMRESGCFGVKIGFESGNQFVVDKIVNKNLDLEKAREVTLELKKMGFTLHGTFTYGLPGETREQMADTRRFIASIPFDTIQESGTAEIEGTPLHSLRQRGSLEKYAGAVLDNDYVVGTDGGKKLQELARDLQS